MNTQKPEDKPEHGKQYVLCGKPGQKSIANGNTWQASEVKPCPTCGATLDLVYDMDEEAGWVDLYYCETCATFSPAKPVTSTFTP
jgi:hypothetical protein